MNYKNVTLFFKKIKYIRNLKDIINFLMLKNLYFNFFFYYYYSEMYTYITLAPVNFFF